MESMIGSGQWECEGYWGEDWAHIQADSLSLGIGHPIAMSAAHGIGVSDMYDVLCPLLPDSNTESDINKVITAEPMLVTDLRRTVTNVPVTGNSKSRKLDEVWLDCHLFEFRSYHNLYL